MGKCQICATQHVQCRTVERRTGKRKKKPVHSPSSLYFRPGVAVAFSHLYLSPFPSFLFHRRTPTTLSFLLSFTSINPSYPTADELRTEYLLWHSRVPESSPQKLKIQGN